MDSVDVTALLWLLVLAALAASFGAGFLVGRASRRPDDEPGARGHELGWRPRRNETTIPVRGSDWESELDRERRQGRAQAGAAIGPPTREASAGILIIPDELSFPITPTELPLGFPEVRHEDGCGLEHDLTRWECVMRPGGGDPGRA